MSHHDDDGGENRDSRLSVELTAGNYTIEATTFRARTEGSFTLTVATDIETSETVAATVDGLDATYNATVDELFSLSFSFEPSAVIPSVQSVSPQTGLNLTVRNRTSSGVWMAGTPTHAGTYAVEFALTQPGRVDTRTTTVNVTCPEGHTQTSDRSCEPPANACTTTLAGGTINSQTLILGPQTGTWEDTCVLPTGRRSSHTNTYYAKHYTFTLAAAANVTIDLTSSEDTYMFLLSGHGPNGTKLHHNDDGGDGYNSRLSNISLAAGDYTISASTFDRERTGNFQIRVRNSVCTTDLGERISGTGSLLTLDLNHQNWAVSDACVSSQPDSSGMYARFFLFTLRQAAEVTIDLSSTSADTHLYLLHGHSSNGTTLSGHNDPDNTASHLIFDLPAGSYTIEATSDRGTASSSARSYRTPPSHRFNLAIKDPLDTYEVKVDGKPWVRHRLLWPTNDQTSVSFPPLPGLDKTVTTRQIGPFLVEQVSITARLAGRYYPVTLRRPSPRGGTTNRSVTLNATCQTGSDLLQDRSCWNPDHDPIPSDLIVPASHWESPDVIPTVGVAALEGMVAAAKSSLPRFRGTNCPQIPIEDQQYQLTRNLLVALLASIQHYEHPGGGSAVSLMALSRSDYLDDRLYSLNNPANYQRAFWHSGVGLWQLDDANTHAQRLTHAERAHAQTGAETALKILWTNYCDTPRDETTSIIVHLQKALSKKCMEWVPRCPQPLLLGI